VSAEWTVERHLEAGSEQGRELVGYFDVTYPVDGPRIRTVSPYLKDLFVHHFRISSIDEDVGRWIRDAYEQMGCGRR
jgi:hypothetical protein